MADGRLVSSVLESGGARAVAVDPERATVWAWTGRSLLALGFDGARHFSVPLALPATIHADLAVRPEDGAVWLAAGHELRSISATGALLASWRLDQPAVELGLDSAAGLLWVATAQSVEAFDAVSGASVRALDFGRVPDVRGLGLTPAGSIWVALRDEARLFTPDGTLLRTIPGRNLVALAAVPGGGAWLADAKSLRRVDATGRDRFTVEPFGGQGSLSALAAHPADGSVWAAAGSSLAKIEATGRIFLFSFPPLPAEGGATGEGGRG